MTCLEAQSNIMAFVDNKLPDDKVTDFARHVRSCPNCSEELEIYYTLIVGMRQLDNNEELSADFKKELNEKLSRQESKVRKVKRFKISTFGVICIGIVFLMMMAYGQILNKVYNIEQNRIKAAQGTMYFYENFADYIDMCGEDIIEEQTQKNKPKEKNFYERIRSYNRTHIIQSDTDEQTE